jgi:hypothetical protein
MCKDAVCVAVKKAMDQQPEPTFSKQTDAHTNIQGNSIRFNSLNGMEWISQITTHEVTANYYV